MVTGPTTRANAENAIPAPSTDPCCAAVAYRESMATTDGDAIPYPIDTRPTPMRQAPASNTGIKRSPPESNDRNDERSVFAEVFAESVQH